MLNSPHDYDPNFIEATVLNVDPIRFICSVRTINNKIMREVRWLLPTGGYSESGQHTIPNIQDRVLISTVLGYPLILGCIPRIEVISTTPPNITGSLSTPDTGSDSSMRGGVVANPTKPSDLVPADFIYTAKGGAMLAVLSQGIAIVKASILSQIILSKFEGLVRIVTRNYQRFSDSSSNVSANVKGRLYEWFGTDWSISHNRTSSERYQEVYGDVAAGEVLLGVPDPAITIPAADTRVRKQWLKDASGNSIMVETLYQDGKVTFIITNGAPTPTTTSTDIRNNQWVGSSTDGTNTATLTISPTNILVNYNNKAKATFNNTQVLVDYNNVSKGTFNSSQTKLESNGHAVTITSSGIAMT